MTSIFGVPIASIYGQLVLGLVNGCFYAMLSLGLSLIFGMLNITNFAHGAFYMMGAVLTWFGLAQFGISYWWSLLLVPIVIAIFGIIVERSMLQWLYKVDSLYGLLLTFGLALVLEGLFRYRYGVSGLPYAIPEAFQGAFNLGFMYLP
jgi:branched-chain amino acid transport system permease protein